MTMSGGCHCGAVRYAVEGEAMTHALCHCTIMDWRSIGSLT
jgi:hypothetical protein